LAGFATDVAVSVTFCCAEITDGAVYMPDEETLPSAGLIDHVTAVLEVPETVAVTC